MLLRQQVLGGKQQAKAQDTVPGQQSRGNADDAALPVPALATLGGLARGNSYSTARGYQVQGLQGLRWWR